MLSEKIQKFFDRKLRELDISKKDLSAKAGVAASVLVELAKGYKKNPHLKTLHKLANALNCSLDEICGRDPKYYAKPEEFLSVSDETAMSNLKIFIEHKIEQTGITAHQLGRLSGFSTRAISPFVGDNTEKQALGSESLPAP